MLEAVKMVCQRMAVRANGDDVWENGVMADRFSTMMDGMWPYMCVFHLLHIFAGFVALMPDNCSSGTTHVASAFFLIRC
jgi:hypothetical protein